MDSRAGWTRSSIGIAFPPSGIKIQLDLGSKRERGKDMAKQPGLDDRHRDNDGQTRAKNGNTRIDTLRETYGPNFAPGIRGDAHLETLLDRAGCESLSEYLKQQKG